MYITKKDWWSTLIQTLGWCRETVWRPHKHLCIFQNWILFMTQKNYWCHPQIIVCMTSQFCVMSAKNKRSNSPSSWLFFSLKRNKLCASSVKCCGLCTGSEWRVVYSFKQKEGLLESHWTLWANKSGCRFRGVFFHRFVEALVGQNTGLEFHKFVHKEHVYICICCFVRYFPIYIYMYTCFWDIPMEKHQPLWDDFSTSRWCSGCKTTSRRKMSRNCWKVGKLPWWKTRVSTASSSKCPSPKTNEGNLQKKALNPSMFGVPCHP